MTISATLSPGAQKVQALLREAGLASKVIEFTESTRTAQEAADRVGCSLGQIVKSLIFQGAGSGKPILVLTSGANRVNEALVSQYAGEAIRRADPDIVRQATGFAIGGVPPIGHASPLDTYLDEDLLQYPSLWAAGGAPSAVFELTPAELQQITNGNVRKVK